MAAGTGRRTAAGLVLGCHPGPTAAVTVVVTALCGAAGWPPGRTALGAAAVLAGQLSVGWSNDARDADQDLRAARTEKPTVRGWVDARTLGVTAAVALTVCVPLSYLAAGPVGGSAHVLAVLSAWAYNLWLLRTSLSVVPYVVSFGLVPAFVTYGLVPPQPPAAWAVVACALLGAGAHLANAVRDLDSDRTVGAGNLAARLGARPSVLGAVGCLVLASAVLLLHLDVAGWLRLGILVVVLGSATVVARRPDALFRYVLVVAVLDALLLVASAGSLVG